MLVENWLKIIIFNLRPGPERRYHAKHEQWMHLSELFSVSAISLKFISSHLCINAIFLKYISLEIIECQRLEFEGVYTTKSEHLINITVWKLATNGKRIKGKLLLTPSLRWLAIFPSSMVVFVLIAGSSSTCITYKNEKTKTAKHKGLLKGEKKSKTTSRKLNWNEDKWLYIQTKIKSRQMLVVWRDEGCNTCSFERNFNNDPDIVRWDSWNHEWRKIAIKENSKNTINWWYLDLYIGFQHP